MRIMPRLGGRFWRDARTEATGPRVLIAERFVPPFEALQWLDLPSDVCTAAPDRPLDAVVIDEFGLHCRRTRISAPPPGMTGNRIEFEMLLVSPKARLWLFIIDAASAGETPMPDLVETLLRHGRSLGGRPPVSLIWDGPIKLPRPEADAEPVVRSPPATIVEPPGLQQDGAIIRRRFFRDARRARQPDEAAGRRKLPRLRRSHD